MTDLIDVGELNKLEFTQETEDVVFEARVIVFL